MERGIADIFRDTFGGIDELRRRYWNKPTYCDVEETLVELRISL